MVTVGGVTSQVTTLSVEKEAILGEPSSAAFATPAPIVATTVPEVVMPVTATLYVVPSLGSISVTVATLAPPAVPERVTSPVAKPVTGLLNTTVKLMGLVEVGSAWVAA
ncbi:MAG: hypothetical protein BWY79_01132 [Actinobacteria bacterium ADurb.Bin444]|nr:MAG: hypothetical protein BWY79_01132 [Actinobacteria bacterium ADurb.Bin444]